MPLVTRVYGAVGGGGGALSLVLRALVAGICLLPPTVLMGATLPAVSRWVRGTREGIAWLGLFYAGNIAGAVIGCLLAGFYLLRVHDMAIATYVAVAVNIGVASVAWVAAPRAAAPGLLGGGGWAGEASGAGWAGEPGQAGRAGDSGEAGGTPAVSAPPGQSAAAVLPTPVMLAIACSGFCALAAEVIWTRTLSLLFSATVYTFSIILAVFLIGLGIGSSAGAIAARRVADPAVALGWCQLLAAASIAWSALMLGSSLPYWPINTSLASSIWFNFQIDLVRATWAILPAPIFWGASFPLALAAAAQADGQVSSNADPGDIVGRLYAANTVGAIVGALGASLILVSWIGSQHAQRLLIGVSLFAALLMLVPRRRLAGAGGALALVMPAALLMLAVPELPGVLVTYGRHAASWAGHTGEIIYVGEGLHATVAVSRGDNGVLNYHNAGKIQASSQPADMRLQRMLGHLTTLVTNRPRSVLVIGCGAGVTAGAVSVNPDVEKVTIVDIEPLVPQVAERFFGTVNHDVLRNPKVRVVVDDARHFLMTTTEKFDAITSDPLDPWVKGAATLYTREFFEAARRHLNPGGVMTLFVQLYESSPEAVKSEVGTFFETFPDGLMFGNTFEGHTIDTVLVGSAEPREIWVDYVEEALRQPAFRPVSRSLGELGLYTATDLFGKYGGRARDMKGWLADAVINRDRNLRLQYLAGFGVNLHAGDEIYRGILDYRTFPDDLFIGSESTLRRLKDAIDGVVE
jgi:spermidine synthase